MRMELITGASNHPAVRRLQEFFSAMHEWEREMLREGNIDFGHLSEAESAAARARQNNALRASLGRIFETCCEAGWNAKRVKDALHCGGREPVYDPVRERITSVRETADRVIIETEQTHELGAQFKYELVMVQGQWMLRDNRKGRIPGRKNWRPWDL